ncbi:MAG: SDR family oxidoreductase [Leptospiraceae bacterium]|nr:SDR family oxidoreductase [Leptospiraceae bacterium]MCP5495528.1 SDR family oxidoreductase [Leptospiraceae bacterium]
MKTNRIAFIAGASGEIGKAVSLQVAKDHKKVYLGYHQNEASIRDLKEEISLMGGNTESIQLNLQDPKQIEEASQYIFDREGRLDILINCVGVNLESPALGMEVETWQKVMDVNLNGTFWLSQKVAKFMVLNRWGRIVNLSSVSARFGGRGQINYSVSKSGIETMTRVLALELSRKGVLVNCVAPGVIETKMSESIREEYKEELLQTISVRRFGKPEEVANLVTFLVSEKSAYITGQVICVDGGMGL